MDNACFQQLTNKLQQELTNSNKEFVESFRRRIIVFISELEIYELVSQEQALSLYQLIVKERQ